MEILDQLQAKVRNAVQKIEELQARVNELEEEKRQNEEKMASMIKEFGDDDTASIPTSVQQSANEFDSPEQD
jgi:FtsZ-binding cell division protein ZapB